LPPTWALGAAKASWPLRSVGAQSKIGAALNACRRADLVTEKLRSEGITSRADLPGNMVELENWLLAAFLSGQDMTPALLRQAYLRFGQPDEGHGEPRDAGLGEWITNRLSTQGLDLIAVENQILAAAVDKACGNLSAAARLVGLTRPQLAYRLVRQ
jgi:DNA-binding NtrC family response regulator